MFCGRTFCFKYALPVQATSVAMSIYCMRDMSAEVACTVVRDVKELGENEGVIMPYVGLHTKKT